MVLQLSFQGARTREDVGNRSTYSFGTTGYRLAFVIRWLSPTTAPTHMFYAEGVRKGEVKFSETEVRQEKALVESNRHARRMKRGLE